MVAIDVIVVCQCQYIYDMIYYMFVIELTNGRLGIIVSYIVYKVIVLVVVDASAVAGGIGA